RRIDVSAAFFDSQEFQETGSFIYRLYKAGLGRLPRYAEFAADRRQVLGGTEQDSAQLAFSEQFVARPEFVERYQAYPTGATFVAALIESVRVSSGVELSSMRAELLDRYQSGRDLAESRALVLAAVDNATSLRRAEYNPGFVLMEYFGYLGRD